MILKRLIKRLLVFLSFVVFSFKFISASIVIPIKKNNLVGAVTYGICNSENRCTWEQFPVIDLDGNNTISISFDLLEPNIRQLSYKIRKMEYDWNESNLSVGRYIKSFNNVDIETSNPSISTLVDYCNYQFDLNAKTDGIGITQSGNFILSVFDKYDPNKIIFEFPFAVLDNKSSISIDKSPYNNTEDFKEVQRLDIGVDFNQPLYDIGNNVKVVVLQNGLWENSVVLNNPSNINTNKLEYKNQNSALFWGSSQFYKIEHIGDKTYGMGINHIYIDNGLYNVELIPNRNKRDISYDYEKDQYGRQVIRNMYSDNDPNIYSDYQLIKFKLISEELKGNDVVLSGECFRFMPEDYIKMKYNHIDRCYELGVLLKMGYQEYKYLTKKRDDNKLYSDQTMGNHYQTMNEYTILVYYYNIKYNSYDLVGYKSYKIK